MRLKPGDKGYLWAIPPWDSSLPPTNKDGTVSVFIREDGKYLRVDQVQEESEDDDWERRDG